MQEDSKPVRAYVDQVELYSPAKLLAEVGTDGDLKKVQTQIPYLSGCLLNDISIKGRGPVEDKVYSKRHNIVQNIRRGNTVLQITSKGKDGTIVARKGLMKFFDISLQFLKGHKYANLSTKETRNLQNYILGAAELALSQNDGVVKVLKTLKANGQNAQISYCKEIKSWIICSKNVSLAARNRKDLDHYEDSRFRFAKLMGETFFDLIEKLSDQEFKSLKSDLDGKTMIGEYVGNQQLQHLVKYQKVTILFYAIVDNYSKDTCIAPSTAFEIFKRYNFDTVSVQDIGTFSSFQNLAGAIHKVFHKVSESQISQEEEGSVLYFVHYSGNKARTLSLCKLKTLEYRVFRKLREKLRNFSKNRKNLKSIKEKFVKEVNELISGYELPKPLSYYVTFANSAFQAIDNNKSEYIDLLENAYIDFCEKISNQLKEKKDFEFEENFFASSVFSQSAQKFPMGQQVAMVKKEGIMLLGVPFIFSPTTQSTFESWFNMQVAMKVDDLEEYKEQAHKVKLALISSPEGLTKEKLDKWITVGYKSNLKEDKEKVEFLVQNLEEISNTEDEATPSAWQSISNPETIEQIATKIEEELSSFFEENKELDSLVEMEKISQSETNLLKILEDLRQDYLSRGGNYPTLIPKEKEESQEQEEVKVEEDPHQQQEEVKEVHSLQSEEKKATNPQYLIGFKPFDFENYTKRLLVIVPMGLPGLGKSTLVKSIQSFCESHDIGFHVVSSDETRKQKIDQILAKNKKISLDEAFQRSGKSAGTAFFKSLEGILRMCYKRDAKSQVLFIDKNHPPNIWDKTVNKTIRECCPPGIDLRVVALTPLCSSIFQYKKTQSSPFSYLCLLQCLSRALKRSDHPTITSSTEPAKVVDIIHDFATYYKGVKFDKTLLTRADLDGLLKLPFTNEDIDPQTYQDDLQPLSHKILSSYKDDRIQFCREYVKKFKDFDKTVLSKNQSKIQTLIKAACSVLAFMFGVSEAVVQESFQVEEEEEKKSVKEEQKEELKEEGASAKKSMPLFLGIKVKEAETVLLKGLKTAAKQIIDHLKDNQDPEVELLREQIEDAKWPMNSSWKRPDDFHVTCLFMGKNQKFLSHPIYNDFKNGNKFKISLKGIVVAPKMILTSIVQVKTEVDNKIPHITLYTDQLKPMHSNDVLEGIFCDFKKKGKQFEFNELYESILNPEGGGFVKTMKSNMKKKKFTIYLVKLHKAIVLQGEANTYY